MYFHFNTTLLNQQTLNLKVFSLISCRPTELSQENIGMKLFHSWRGFSCMVACKGQFIEKKQIVYYTPLYNSKPRQCICVCRANSVHAGQEACSTKPFSWDWGPTLLLVSLQKISVYKQCNNSGVKIQNWTRIVLGACARTQVREKGQLRRGDDTMESSVVESTKQKEPFIVQEKGGVGGGLGCGGL